MFICHFGERQLMLEKEDNYPIRNRMKRLELVDKEFFYISFNTRDN